MKNRIKILKIKLPPKCKAIELTISRCEYNTLPYISKLSPSSNYYKSVPTNMRHNVWILAFGNNDPISSEQELEDMKNAQVINKPIEITICLSQRDSKTHTRTNIGERWSSFDQMRMIKMKIIDSDANNKSISTHIKTSNKNDNKKHHNSGYRTIKVNLEGKTRTIQDIKSDSKNSITWKNDVNNENEVELQIQQTDKCRSSKIGFA